MSLEIDALKHLLKRTSHWRRGLAERFHDPRNGRAAVTLERLAQMPERSIEPELLAQLRPLLSAPTPATREAIIETARRVEFSQHPVDLTEFSENLLQALWEAGERPAGVAIAIGGAR